MTGVSRAFQVASHSGRPDEIADLYGELASLVDRPAWQAQARCRGFGTDAFFPGRGTSLRPSVRDARYDQSAAMPARANSECGVGSASVDVEWQSGKSPS
jgi:hypothetical protein